MKDYLIQNPLSVRKSTIHGYGVFAERDFAKDEILEECYCLLQRTTTPEFRNYSFIADKYSAICTGFGCIYNHSKNPNATYNYDSEHQIMTYRTKRPIEKGEEIFIWYGNDWFSSRNLNMKQFSLWHKIRNFLMTPLSRGLTLVGLIYLTTKILQG